MNTSCAHSRIEATLDRWQESHWHIHQMETNYHYPDLFRYCLNSFIRASKEIPQILTMEIQQDKTLKSALKQPLEHLRQDDLFQVISKKRDFIVHQGMLDLRSHGSVGIVEGAQVKMKFPFAVHPRETSDVAFARYQAACRKDSFLRGLTGPDEDSAPCIWRTWILPGLPEKDVLDVSVTAWTTVGGVLSSAIETLGGDALDLSFSCRHGADTVQIKRFSQAAFFKEVDGIDLGAPLKK